jgi:hypothetical protein
MDKTRTPLVKWFMAFYLMAENERGISALMLAKRVKIAYNTAWTICHKIRHVMKERDMGYKTDIIVDMDEFFFGTPKKGGKHGRGADKTAVLVPPSLSNDEKP